MSEQRDWLDDGWAAVRRVASAHGHELDDATCREISVAVANDLLARSHVITWRTHADATEAHCARHTASLVDELEVLRRQLDHPIPVSPI